MSDSRSIKVRQPIVGAKNSASGSSGGGLWSNFPADALARRTNAYFYFNDFDAVPGSVTSFSNNINAGGGNGVGLDWFSHTTTASNTITYGTTNASTGGRIVVTTDGTQYHGIDQLQFARQVLPATVAGGTTMMEACVGFPSGLLGFAFIGLYYANTAATANGVLTAATGAVTTTNAVGAWFYFNPSVIPTNGGLNGPSLQYAGPDKSIKTVAASTSYTSVPGGASGLALNRYGIRITSQSGIEWFIDDRRIGQVRPIASTFNATVLVPSFALIANTQADVMHIDYLACGATPRQLTT